VLGLKNIYFEEITLSFGVTLLAVEYWYLLIFVISTAVSSLLFFSKNTSAINFDDPVEFTVTLRNFFSFVGDNLFLPDTAEIMSANLF